MLSLGQDHIYLLAVLCTWSVHIILLLLQPVCSLSLVDVSIEDD
jgi:hypothetical protein